MFYWFIFINSISYCYNFCSQSTGCFFYFMNISICNYSVVANALSIWFSSSSILILSFLLSITLPAISASTFGLLLFSSASTEVEGLFIGFFDFLFFACLALFLFHFHIIHHNENRHNIFLGCELHIVYHVPFLVLYILKNLSRV